MEITTPPTGLALLDEVRLRKYYKKILRTERASLISYLPIREASGAVAIDLSGNGRNGAYTNVTLGQPGVGDGWTSGLFNGSTSYLNWHSASLAVAFNGAEGTLLIWAKVANAGVWTNGLSQYLLTISVDGGSNIIALEKTVANNTLKFMYIAGGTDDSFSLTPHSPTAWTVYGLTWDKTNDAVKAYAGGSLLNTAATIGTWAGVLDNTRTVIGGRRTSANFYFGNLYGCALWSKALTPAQVKYVSVV